MEDMGAMLADAALPGRQQRRRAPEWLYVSRATRCLQLSPLEASRGRGTLRANRTAGGPLRQVHPLRPRIAPKPVSMLAGICRPCGFHHIDSVLPTTSTDTSCRACELTTVATTAGVRIFA